MFSRWSRALGLLVLLNSVPEFAPEFAWGQETQPIVSIGEWAFISPEEQAAAENQAGLSTQGIFTCVGLAGRDPVTGSIFLAHLLYYDEDHTKSVAIAKNQIRHLVLALNQSGLSLKEFELTWVGGAGPAWVFGQDLVQWVEDTWNVRAIDVRLGGSSTLDVKISAKQLLIRQAVPPTLIVWP